MPGLVKSEAAALVCCMLLLLLLLLHSCLHLMAQLFLGHLGGVGLLHGTVLVGATDHGMPCGSFGLSRHGLGYGSWHESTRGLDRTIKVWRLNNVIFRSMRYVGCLSVDGSGCQMAVMASRAVLLPLSLGAAFLTLLPAKVSSQNGAVA